MPDTNQSLSMICLMLCGALFGFFYAWVCSTMWGLDAADPRVAIEAMQAMNASVRNAVFAPAFFGTPVALLLTTLIFFYRGQTSAARWFTAATIFVGPLAVIVTIAVNVPMNEALALIDIPKDQAAAHNIWVAYSPDWQFWNQFRTVTSGLGLLCIALGMLRLTAD